jgi:glycosyltransferase involved in cell wall biosynthesis
MVERLVANVRRAGARLIYALDDNFLDMSEERKDWHPTDDQLWVTRFLLQEADGVVVTTPLLKERLAHFNPTIMVVPNALDERLLPAGKTAAHELWQRIRTGRFIVPSDSAGHSVVGYMGTLTHDDDLLMIVPALRAIWARYPGRIELQIVGVIGHPETMRALDGLPIRYLRPRAVENPGFMRWFSRLHWDIALAPLRETAFNQCKSDIKFLDYSAMGAAGIYSRVAAYASTVRHRETGWLAENTVEAWSDALEELLGNVSLRRSMADNARRYLYAERVWARCAPLWVQAIENIAGMP